MVHNLTRIDSLNRKLAQAVSGGQSSVQNCNGFMTGEKVVAKPQGFEGVQLDSFNITRERPIEEVQRDQVVEANVSCANKARKKLKIKLERNETKNLPSFKLNLKHVQRKHRRTKSNNVPII